MSTINYVVTNSTSALIDNNLVIATIYIAYALVGVCSFIGNVSVLLLVVVGREMLHSATNIFVGSLSATDLLITCVSHWATPYYTIRNNNWNLGSFMCYAVSAVQAASLMWSPFTLSAIAIDRYRSVVARPTSGPLSITRCLVIIVAIWLVAIFMISPMLVHVQYFYISDEYRYCLELWPNDSSLRLVYGLSVFAVRSAAPLLIISYCHWRIARLLTNQSRRLALMRSPGRQLQDVRRKQRLQTLLLVMVLIFAISSFPLDLYNVIQDMEIVYAFNLIPSSEDKLLRIVVHWISMTGTLLNPMVYAWWNDHFRRQLKHTIRRFSNWSTNVDRSRALITSELPNTSHVIDNDQRPNNTTTISHRLLLPPSVNGGDSL